MNFKPENFRSFDDESRRDADFIRCAEHSPLILIKGDGRALYGRTRGEKDGIAKSFNEETDLLLWAWAGQWHTDVFRLMASDLVGWKGLTGNPPPRRPDKGDGTGGRGSRPGFGR
jgi:hypothetical protein